MTTSSHALPAGPDPQLSTMGVPAAPLRAPRRSSTHAHLWVLPDGTGLHAPAGRLVHDPDTGRLCCHLCGRWFVSLGSHVQVHGYSADGYREAMGLLRSRALVTAGLSRSISARQADAYRTSERVRERFAVGQALARDGQLAWRARGANTAGSERLERSRSRSRDLATGRATAARRRQEHLENLLSTLGAASLEEYVRTAYVAGASLDALSRATGVGHARLRRTVIAAGVTLRATGHNTAAGKRSRALTAEAEAARRLGTDDLPAWLAERHAQGWPLTRLAAAVGHTTHWVRARLPASTA